jgi:hypothetical protein
MKSSFFLGCGVASLGKKFRVEQDRSASWRRDTDAVVRAEGLGRQGPQGKPEKQDSKSRAGAAFQGELRVT